MITTIQVKDANNNTQTVSTVDALLVDGGQATIGTSTDIAKTNTDGTSVSLISAAKQISKSVQILANNSTSVSTSAGSAERNVIVDPVSGNAALVQAFHNSDNQVIGGTAYGLFTGGVAQVINQAGALDRQRETGFDNIPAAGVATGTQQLAGPLLSTTVSSGAITGNATSGNTQFVTLTAVSFINRGVTQTIQAGSTVLVDSGNANQEYVFCTGANTTGITGQFMKGHGAAVTVSAFAFNQARDATIPDGSNPAGIGASATYLFNATSNTVEFERSAAGELDGGSGVGTNIAAEYEYNSNPPKYSNSTYTAPSSTSYDRARNVQGVGLSKAAITGALANNLTSITVNNTANLATLTPGAQIILDYQGANVQTNYVATSYTLNSQTIPLQFATTLALGATANIAWGTHLPLGPSTNGFLAAGIGIEEGVVFDPVSNLFYIEVSATNDAISGQNVVVEAPGMYNGTTIDRARANWNSPSAVMTITTANTANGTLNSADQTNYSARGVFVNWFCTANTGTASFTVAVQSKDTVSGQYYTLCTSPSVTANQTAATYQMQVYPGSVVTTNNFNFPVPRTWRLQVVPTAGTGNNFSGTFGVNYIV